MNPVFFTYDIQNLSIIKFTRCLQRNRAVCALTDRGDRSQNCPATWVTGTGAT
jgi:hypothetical protein